LAKAHHKVEERPVTLEELKDCQEAFICSTTKQILPVSAIDGTPIQNGAPGPVTRQLIMELQELQGIKKEKRI
jgi:branched-subunit amino acid aminotransferase/4-amino-4-deoxychorismate lyase